MNYCFKEEEIWSNSDESLDEEECCVNYKTGQT